MDNANKKKKINSREIVAILSLSAIFLLQIVVPLFYGDINLIDEGQFGAWANHMYLGAKMYKDIYITYGPLSVYPLYLLFILFHPSAFLVRIYLTAGTILGLISMYLLAKMITKKKLVIYVVMMIGIILPIFSLRIGVGLLTLYAFFKADETEMKRWYIFSGGFCALSFLVSPEISIFSLIIIVISYIIQSIHTTRLLRSICRYFCFIFGAVVILSLFSIWAKGEGWLNAYLFTTVDVFQSFSGINLPNGQGFPNAISLFPQTWSIISLVTYLFSKELLLYWLIGFYIIVFLYLTVKVFLRIYSYQDRYIFLIASFGVLLYSILLGRFGIGHFFFVLSPMVLLSGVFSERLWYQLREKNEPIQAKLFAGFLLGLLILFYLRLFLIYRIEITKKFSYPLLQGHTEQSFRLGPLTISSQQTTYIIKMQHFINLHTNANDYVFFLSNEPMLYLLVNRRNPTQYDLPFIANTKEKRYDMLFSLQERLPKYIFYNSYEWSVDGIPNTMRLPEVYAFIQQKYMLVDSIEGVSVYQVRESSDQ